eukprot:jgi/Mesen1/8667/ME000504S08102
MSLSIACAWSRMAVCALAYITTPSSICPCSVRSHWHPVVASSSSCPGRSLIGSANFTGFQLRINKRVDFSTVVRPLTHLKRSFKVSAKLDDYDYTLDGPLDPIIPKFRKDAIGNPSDTPVTVPKSSGKNGLKIGRKMGKKFKRATPLQALLGSGTAGLSAWGLYNAVTHIASFLSEHPPVRQAPGDLNARANELILTMVTTFGAFGVGVFGIAAVGLLLLAIQNATADIADSKR